MFDTVSISKTFFRAPDIDLLERNGCKPCFNQYTGEPYKLFLNGEKNAKEPRLTISKSPKELWILKAETSICNWLFGSNTVLPSDADMQEFFLRLSDYVSTKTGIKFESQKERVSRVDFTRDFQLEESKVLTVLAELKNFRLPKYQTRPCNDTTVYFESCGKKLTKRYKVYSKSHEVGSKESSEAEMNLSRGVLRLEIEHRTNKAVYNLAKSLKLPNHNANNILTRATSEKVIEKTIKMLNLEVLLKKSRSHIEMLARSFDSLTALKYAGHLLYKAEYGSEYGKLPFISISEDTIRKYDKACAKAGILSLE